MTSPATHRFVEITTITLVMDDSDDDEVIGPMPATGPVSSAHDGVQSFLEREERQRAREKEVTQAKESASARPDWMLTMPSTVEGARTHAIPLRARGFQQSHGRAQRVENENTAEAQRLWTETPAHRRERITQSAGGSALSTVQDDEAQKLRQDHIFLRDAAIREKVNRLVSMFERSS